MPRFGVGYGAPSGLYLGSSHLMFCAGKVGSRVRLEPLTARSASPCTQEGNPTTAGWSHPFLHRSLAGGGGGKGQLWLPFPALQPPPAAHGREIKACEAQLRATTKPNFVSSWHAPQNSSLASRSGFQIKAISATAGSNWFKAKIHSFFTQEKLSPAGAGGYAEQGSAVSLFPPPRCQQRVSPPL